MESIEKKTDQEIQAAYVVVKRLAKSVSRRMKTSRSSILDEDDLAQEGMIAWLQGKNMYFAMIRASRDSAFASRYAHDVKGISDPFVTSLDETCEQLPESSDIEDEIASQIDGAVLLQRVCQIKNDDAKFAILAYFFCDMSLRQLGKVFGKSHEWVRTWLIEPELKAIREELK